MTRQPPAGAGGPVRAALQRARAAQRRRSVGRSRAGRTVTALVCAVTGLLVVVSAVNARGTDLRPGRNTDLVSLVQAQSRRNSDLARKVTVLREQVDAQARSGAPEPGLAPQVERESQLTGCGPWSDQR